MRVVGVVRLAVVRVVVAVVMVRRARERCAGNGGEQGRDERAGNERHGELQYRRIKALAGARARDEMKRKPQRDRVRVGLPITS